MSMLAFICLSTEEGRPVPKVKHVLFSVQKVDKVKAAASYKVLKKVPLKWAIPKPENIALEIYECYSSLTENTLLDKDKMTHSLLFELSNKGNQRIQSLKLQVRLYDTTGKQVGEKVSYPVIRSDPRIHSGQWRVHYTLGLVPIGTEALRYELSVLECR